MMKSSPSLVSVLVIAVTTGYTGHAIAEDETLNLKLSGDMRYRHETIDVENKDLRNRQRIRARLGLSAQVNERITLGFRAATGNDDPVSTNQTLTDGFSSKPVILDLAYFEWKMPSVNGMVISGGKVKNPFHTPMKTELLWDNDLSPEGLAFAYSLDSGTVKMFVNGSYFWVEERAAANDAVLLGGQAGVDWTGSSMGVLVSAGYFDYQNARHNAPFYNHGDSFGNSVDNGGEYLYGFNEAEVIFECRPAGILEKATVFADYVANVARDAEDNTGWLAGVSYGACKAPGSYEINYTYRRLEKNAVVGAFTDSEFIGGGTGGEGHKVNFGIQLAAKTKAALSYFLNQVGLEDGKEYHRFQLDINVAL